MNLFRLSEWNSDEYRLLKDGPMELTASQITEIVSGNLYGNPDVSVTGVSSLDRSQPNTLTFLSDARETSRLASTTSEIVLMPEGCDPTQIEFSGEALIACQNPFDQFINLLPRFLNCQNQQSSGIHPTSVIESDVELGEEISIGANVVIGRGCRIGDRCTIHPGVVLGKNVILGNDVILHPKVVLYDDCQLEDRVIIQAGSVIGGDGFGYQFQDGAFHKIEHYGSVLLEEGVEVGSCTTIDRGMFEPTVIGRGTKIDNLVMIAHNCRIGAHNVIVSQVGLAGSVTSGDYCRFGGQVGIADHVHIGKGVSLMAQAGVFRDIEDGQTVLGSPALPMDQKKKIYMAETKLPEMRQTLRKLQKEVAKLQSQLIEQNSADSESINTRNAA